MVNTHSAAGRMVLMNLANYAQFEREMISEKDSRDAAAHDRPESDSGPAPYGYEFSNDVDAKGGVCWSRWAHEQEVLRKDQGNARRRA